jgi:hypothetical protein
MYNYYNYLEPCALNADFQHFIPRWYKTSLLCGPHPKRGYGVKTGRKTGWRQDYFKENSIAYSKLHLIVALQWKQNVFLTRQVKNICPFSYGAMATFWFLLCTHASASFYWLYIYSQKAIWLNVVKSFLRFLVARIPSNFKKIHQIYIHGSSKYPKTLKDFLKNGLSYLAYG